MSTTPWIQIAVYRIEDVRREFKIPGEFEGRLSYALKAPVKVETDVYDDTVSVFTRASDRYRGMHGTMVRLGKDPNLDFELPVDLLTNPNSRQSPVEVNINRPTRERICMQRYGEYAKTFLDEVDAPVRLQDCKIPNNIKMSRKKQLKTLL